MEELPPALVLGRVVAAAEVVVVVRIGAVEVVEREGGRRREGVVARDVAREDLEEDDADHEAHCERARGGGSVRERPFRRARPGSREAERRTEAADDERVEQGEDVDPRREDVQVGVPPGRPGRRRFLRASGPSSALSLLRSAVKGADERERERTRHVTEYVNATSCSPLSRSTSGFWAPQSGAPPPARSESTL